MISRKRFLILAGIVIAVVIMLLWISFSKAAGTKYDVCYEMTNQGIEWTGAGYNGIRGR